MNTHEEGDEHASLTVGYFGYWFTKILETPQDVSQTSIAAASGVTEVTIRNRIKDLKSSNTSSAIRGRIFP